MTVGKRKNQNWTPAKYLHCFQEVVRNYEQEHPHWRLEVLVSLIKWGIRNLRHCIERELSSEITWSDPLVELHYRIEWDWNAPRDEDVVCGRQNVGTMTKENASDSRSAAKTLAKMMAHHFNTMGLSWLTNGAWFEKHTDKYIPYLPPDLAKAVSRIRGKWRRLEALEAMFKPFWIGTTRIDPSGNSLYRSDDLPSNIAKRLENLGQQMDIPGISFHGPINGRKMWSGLVFEVQPLIVDYDRHQAYFPITVGLAFEHKLIGGDHISFTPSSWPSRDRAAFWSEVLLAIEKAGKNLIPKRQVQDSIILLVNDKVLLSLVQYGGFKAIVQLVYSRR